jgi:hypothetical protein
LSLNLQLKGITIEISIGSCLDSGYSVTSILYVLYGLRTVDDADLQEGSLDVARKKALPVSFGSRIQIKVMIPYLHTYTNRSTLVPSRLIHQAGVHTYVLRKYLACRAPLPAPCASLNFHFRVLRGFAAAHGSRATSHMMPWIQGHRFKILQQHIPGYSTLLCLGSTQVDGLIGHSGGLSILDSELFSPNSNCKCWSCGTTCRVANGVHQPWH